MILTGLLLTCALSCAFPARGPAPSDAPPVPSKPAPAPDAVVSRAAEATAQRKTAPETNGCHPSGVTHRVERGETLWRIAHRYGVPLDHLARCNGIPDPTRIEAGAVLTIPEAPQTAAAAGDAARPARAGADPAPPAPQKPDADARHDEEDSGETSGTTSRPSEPFRWPLSGVLASGYGPRNRKVHAGLDLTAPEGTEILASRRGRVIYSGDGFRGYGNMIVLDHADGFVSVYAHASALVVQEGEEVAAGQTIARVGHTGNATAPHLHFEIREGDRPLDPLTFLEPLATSRGGSRLAPRGTAAASAAGAAGAEETEAAELLPR